MFEEDKKDVDIEIPKVCLCFCCCFSNQQIIRNWREQNWGSLRLLRLSSKVWFLETPELVLILTQSYIPMNFFRKNLTTLFIRKLGKKKQRFKLWRKKFLSGLQSVGLDIEDVGLIIMRWRDLTRLQYCRRSPQKPTVTFTSSSSMLPGLSSALMPRNSIWGHHFRWVVGTLGQNRTQSRTIGPSNVQHWVWHF